MSKFDLQIQKTYRPGDRDIDIRTALRNSLHPPEKRTISNTLLLIGLVTLAIVGGGMLGLMR